MKIEQLVQPIHLATSFAIVRRRSPVAGVDGVTPDAFAGRLEENLAALSATLRDGTYVPARLLRINRPKPHGGTRRLAIPTVADRIVIEVLRGALAPVVEPMLTSAACAYRPGRSARSVVELVQRRIEAGAAWVALADIRDFFDSVPLLAVVEAVRGVHEDPQVARLCDRLLGAHALHPGRGLAQGSSLSPLLSNLVLTPMDRRLLQQGFPLLRYCDNLCVPCTMETFAHEALSAIRREVTRLSMTLKPGETRVAETRAGFPWLGFWLGPGGGRVSDGAVSALRERVAAAAKGLTGDMLRERLRALVRGWMQYFDAPLPDGVSLGEHEGLLRALIAECSGASADPPGVAAPVGTEKDADGAPEWGDQDLEPWDDQPGPHLWAQGPEGPGPQVERLLLLSDRHATAGKYEEAEAAYEQAQRLSTSAGPEAPPEPAPGPTWDEEALDTFIGLFAGGQDLFESAPRGRPGHLRAFAPVARPISPADVRAHLNGQASLAVRPRLPDGTCTLGVIDIDGGGAGEAGAVGPGVGVQAYAQALAGAARALGFEVLLEITGGRGIHLWVPVLGRVRAEAMARGLKALLAAAGTPAAPVKVECLPGGDGSPDLHQQAMTLPLGMHVETGRRSVLRWSGGTEVGPDLSGLMAGRPNDPSLFSSPGAAADSTVPAASVPAMEPAPSCEVPEWLDHGKSVARVMQGCAVLRHLASKAAAVGHLVHAERLSLLYSLGHLGTDGREAIHSIISKCQNYSAAETDRQLGKLSGLPIGCTRMREKHATPEVLPLCNCEFSDVRRHGGYPTPLLHAAGFRRTWRQVLRDRRQVEAQPSGPPAAVAVAEPVSDRAAWEEGEARGVLLSGTPPHEWA